MKTIRKLLSQAEPSLAGYDDATIMFSFFKSATARKKLCMFLNSLILPAKMAVKTFFFG